MHNITHNYTLYFAEAAAADAAAESASSVSATDPAAADAAKSAAKDDRNTPKYSDADLDRIIARRQAKWAKQQSAAVDEATRLANMTAQERAEHERDALKAELEELKRANVVAEMERTARGILQADGVTVPDEIVHNLVGDDADATSANVKAFALAYKTAVQAEVKRQLAHKSPSGGTSGAAKMTKAEIMAIKDPTTRQQAIRDNMDLFRRKS